MTEPEVDFTADQKGKTNILPEPETKQDKIFYFLFDQGEQTAERLVEIGELTDKNAFAQLKNRNKENFVVSRKDGALSYYDISNEIREKIQLQINQRKNQIEEDNREKLKEQIEEEKSENKILEIKKLISDHKCFKRKENSIYLDFQELSELSPSIFLELTEHPEETIKNFEIALRDFSFENMPLRFSNFSEILESKAIENLRSIDIDKLQLIKARVSSLSDVRPQIINIKFECPSCGTLISISQLEKRIREPVRCSCGRRGGFKPSSKELIDRAKCELQDLGDLTESPQTREISSFVKDHLTESKELSKFNPGSEVKVLCVLKSVENTAGGYKNTSLDLYLDVLEGEPFEEIIDLDSFDEEEIKQFKELSAKISNENSLNEIRESFAPDIIGNESPKETLILKQAQGRGRKNKSNILFISDPGLAKSRLVKKYHSLMPGSSYVSGSGSSAVGLTATVEKKEEGWILKPGVLPTTKEDSIIDEFNLTPEEDRGKLQEGMSEGQITINKASIHSKLKVSCGIIACANPLNGIFDEKEDLVKQFNIPPQLLNRFDAIFKIQDTKNSLEDKKIARQMLLRSEDRIEQKYNDEFLKRFFLYVRNQPEPTYSNEVMEYIPEKYAIIRESQRKMCEPHKVNARFVEAVERFAKAMAKLKFNKQVLKKDVDFVIEILGNTYLNLDEVEDLRK